MGPLSISWWRVQWVYYHGLEKTQELGQMWEGNSRGLSLSVLGCTGWKVRTVWVGRRAPKQCSWKLRPSSGEPNCLSLEVMRIGKGLKTVRGQVEWKGTCVSGNGDLAIAGVRQNFNLTDLRFGREGCHSGGLCWHPCAQPLALVLPVICLSLKIVSPTCFH